MRFSHAFSSLSLGVVATLTQAAEITLGSLTLDWPVGYTLKSTKPPFELAGPGGVKVMVTVMRPGASAQSGPEAVDQLRAKIDSMLIAQAQKAGKLVLPLARETLSDGTMLHAVGSEQSGLFKRGYLLQYALLSPGGPLALLTFEGQGDAASQHAGAKGVFANLRWGSGEGSAAERLAFTERAAAALRAELGDTPVLIADPLTLKIGELQANLDRVYTYCRANAQGCDVELRRYVLSVADVSRNAALPVDRESLRAVVRTTEFADAAGKSYGQGHRRTVAEGLVALAFVDSPTSARALAESDGKKLGLSMEQAYELALDNLRRSLKPLADVAKPVLRGDIAALEGDFYESSRVLLHADWAPLARAQGGVLVVALPTKDGLLYCSDDSPPSLDALRQRVREAMRRSPGPLTDRLLRWTEAGWQLVR